MLPDFRQIITCVESSPGCAILFFSENLTSKTGMSVKHWDG